MRKIITKKVKEGMGKWANGNANETMLETSSGRMRNRENKIITEGKRDSQRYRWRK